MEISWGKKKEAMVPDVMELKAMQELRFEAQSSFKLQVLKGSLEYFGIKYDDPKNLYELQGRGTFFSWMGASFRLHGKLDVCTKEDNTTMVIYANLHVALNKLREKSKQSGNRGPVVMLAGPSDVGKSSLCRILLNYAVQTNWTPIFVDVDVGQNDIGMPATIGATKVTHTITPDTLHHPHHTSVYPFGHITPSNNLSHYHHLISRLAQFVDARMKNDVSCGSSGVVINTCGWVTEAGYRALVHTAKSFNVDQVVVLGDPELSNSLSSFSSSILLPSSPAVVKRDREERYNRRQQRLHKYLFEGCSTPPTSITTNIQASNTQSGNTQPSNTQSGNTQPSNTHPSHTQPSYPFMKQPASTSVLVSKASPGDAPQPTSKLNPLASSFEPAIKQPSLHPSTSLQNFSSPTTTSTALSQLKPPPRIFEVFFKSVKIFVINDNFNAGSRRRDKLLPIRLNTQHSRMVLVLSHSPSHLLNNPIIGTALILQVMQESMLMMTSCPFNPPCMLLMPSLHFSQPDFHPFLPNN